ncbi:EamA family transporter RarD [Breoghania sp.]|uniref:EamA family transporter RarD n=1 Tax=Breoghania sp. TaxID=2065378 RepID=UPI002AA881A2|nr:EamA family transporter RarD [Breoghania sp.]
MKTNSDVRRPADAETIAYVNAVAAYGLWGVLPLYFMLVSAVPSGQLVAQRIVWSVLVVGTAFFLARRMDLVMDVLRDRRVISRLSMSACIIALNWLVFIVGVDAHRVLEISFGYFINPLVSVALGTVLLGERLSRGQCLAVGIAAIAIAIQAWGLGSFPWISLALAFSFGIYGFLRKTVVVGAATGLLVEAAVLLPVALAYLGWCAFSGTLMLGDDVTMMLLIAASGVVTAVPLILFARGVQGLPLSTIGILQYLAPSLNFLLAIFVFDEKLDPSRLISFALIWVSLVVFTRDLLHRRAATVAAQKANAAAVAGTGGVD